MATKSTSRKAASRSAKKTTVTAKKGGKATNNKNSALSAVNVPVIPGGGIARPAAFYRQLPNSAEPKGPGAYIPQIQRGFIGRLFHPFEGVANTSRQLFFATAAGPQFFCANDRVVKAAFGVKVGDRLLYTAGSRSGTHCTVVGIRGALLWVVNDQQHPGRSDDTAAAATASLVPAAVAADTTGVFANGFAVPLAHAHSAKDLRAVYGLETTGVTEVPSSLEVGGLPTPLLNFLQYAADFAVTIAGGSASSKPHRVYLSPTLAPTGEAGWSQSTTVLGGAGNATEEEQFDTAVIVAIAPEILPADKLPVEECVEEEAEEGEEQASDDAAAEGEDQNGAANDDAENSE